MKKLSCLITLSFMGYFSIAQNVGIGTNNPSERLEVKTPLRSTLKISSSTWLDTTQLLLSNRNGANEGTDFSIKNVREEGLFFSSVSDVSSNTTANSLVITPGGNVGTGIVPTAKLHINGNIKLEGVNQFEFGAGVSGKEPNAGKVVYNGFGTNALAIVGAGTTASNRRVTLFAEGGTNINGPLAITGNTSIVGQLQFSGNPGTAGQVLTSNGAAAPTWRNTSYNNNTKFAFRLEQFSPATNSSATGGALIVGSSIYNLDPASVSVTIGSENINITKSGLYHFELSYTMQFYYASPSTPDIPYNTSSISIDYPGGFNQQIAYNAPMHRKGTAGAWYHNETRSIEVYLTAPRVLNLYSSLINLVAPTNGLTQNGYIYGHLISE